MAPQFTAMNGACFLALKWWMILLKLSLPTPLSPKMSTFISVGATFTAVSSAVVSNGE
jgi:hypothetical protein